MRMGFSVHTACRIANIDPNDAMALPHDAKPDEFFGKDTHPLTGIGRFLCRLPHQRSLVTSAGVQPRRPDKTQS